MNRQSKRIPTKRARPRVIHSERTAHIAGHKRVRLTRKSDIDKRRAEVFERAGGRCEEWIVIGPDYVEGFGACNKMKRCPNRATQWSHAKHAARKCDCYSPTAAGACSIASCEDCHTKRHNCGGKPITVTKKSLKERIA
jgi:hypothetical protein